MSEFFRIFTVIILKFEQCGFTIEIMRPKAAGGMINSVDPGQEQYDRGLQCLSCPVCPKTQDHAFGVFWQLVLFQSYRKLVPERLWAGNLQCHTDNMQVLPPHQLCYSYGRTCYWGNRFCKQQYKKKRLFGMRFKFPWGRCLEILYNLKGKSKNFNKK